MVRKVLIWPNLTLNEVSAPVENPLAPGVKELVADLIETMRARRGVGLAAIQVGVPLRVFVSEPPSRGDVKVAKVFINPVIEELIDAPVEVEEGCLSLPGIYERTLRHPEVVVTYQSVEGDSVIERRVQLAGLEAQIAQHEIEHLDGKIFVGPVGTVKRDLLKRKIAKALRGSK